MSPTEIEMYTTAAYAYLVSVSDQDQAIKRYHPAVDVWTLAATATDPSGHPFGLVEVACSCR